MSADPIFEAARKPTERNSGNFSPKARGRSQTKYSIHGVWVQTRRRRKLGPPGSGKAVPRVWAWVGFERRQTGFQGGVGVLSDVCPPLKRGAIFSYTSYTATGMALSVPVLENVLSVDPVLEAPVPQTFANICLPLSSHSRIWQTRCLVGSFGLRVQDSSCAVQHAGFRILKPYKPFF